LKTPWFVLKLLLAFALGFNFGSRFELIAESVVDIWIEYLSDRFCCLTQLTITLTHLHLCPEGAAQGKLLLHSKKCGVAV